MHLSLGMPYGHPLFCLQSIGKLLEAIFLFNTWYVFCLECLVWYEYFLFILPHPSLLYTPFDRDTHESWGYSMCFTYIFWARQFCLVLHLYLFRACQWCCFKEIDELSWFTYIILSVLNIMVICLGYEFSPNMMGIQEGYNKNFHIKCIEYMKSLIPCICFEIWRWWY